MDPESLRIIQLTDTHMIADPDAELHGLDPFAALQSMVDLIQRDGWQPHLLVVTGDLSDDGSPASYRRLRSLLISLDLPVYCVPGNHDVLAEMQAHLGGGSIQLARRVVREPWQIVFLDSQLPGQVHGFLSPGELNALEETLQEMPGHHALVGLHHGPFPVCPMPPCRLENAETLLAILARYPQVRAVISGHNHCAVDEQQNGIRMLVTPSTCVYLDHPPGPQAPAAQRFGEVHGLDPTRRAFRRLELHPDGTVVTNLIWDHTAM
jgi:Icc protein